MTLKALEGKLELKEKEVESVQEANVKLREELKVLISEVERARDINIKLERELNNFQDEHNDVSLQENCFSVLDYFQV